MRLSPAIAGLFVPLCAVGLVAQDSAAPAATERHRLASCEALERAHQVHESSRILADFLVDTYATTHPAAAVLGRSLAEIAATLDDELGGLEETHRGFQESWESFDAVVRRSPLPRDPRLRPVLSRYGAGAEELGGQLGCSETAEGADLIPCPAIPLAHLLAVVGEDLRNYIEVQYGDGYPDQAEASRELARAARALHQMLHDLEIAVAGTLELFGALETAFEGSSLTDTDEPDDLAVKSRLTAVAEAMAALAASVESCHGAHADAEHDPAASSAPGSDH